MKLYIYKMYGIAVSYQMKDYELIFINKFVNF